MGPDTGHRGLLHLISRIGWAVKNRMWLLVPVILAAIAGLLLIFSLLVKALWNWLMPEIFGLPSVTLWQAFGLMLLANLLFGASKNHSDSHHSSGGGGDRRPRERTGSGTDRHVVESYGVQRQPERPEQPDIDEERTAEFERYWREEGRQAYQCWLERVLEEKKNDGNGNS